MAHGGAGMDYGELRRHWPLLAPCVAGIMLSAINGFSLGVMLGPIEQELGWTRAQIASGPFIVACMALLFSPVAGHLIDRFGPRRMALAGVTLFCAMEVTLATITPNIAGWWLRWSFIGLAALFVMPTVWVTALNTVFDRNRGLALAIALCGTGVAAALVPVLTHWLVAWQGWRGAYVGLSILFAAIVLPLVVLLFRSPADDAVSLRARGEEASLPGFGAREGFASPAFLKLTSAVFLFGVTSCALTANAVPILIAQGITVGEAAGLAGLIGIGSIAGRLGGGFLLDRFDARLIAAFSTLTPALCAALLLGAPGNDVAVALACLLLGISAGTEVDACSYLAARHFGMRSFGTLYGTVNGVVLFGAGVTPVATNHWYDATGTYDGVLMMTIPVCVVAAALFLWLGRYPDFGTSRTVATGGKAAVSAG